MWGTFVSWPTSSRTSCTTYPATALADLLEPIARMEPPECSCDGFDASILVLDSYTPYLTADTTAFPSTATHLSTSTTTSRTFNASAVLRDVSEIIHLWHSTFDIQIQSRLPRYSCDELETGHRLPRHPEGEWPRLPVHYSLQQIKPVYKDIEGMDPLQVPLWKFLYQGLNNTGFVAKPMAAMSSPALRQHRYDCLCG